MNPGVELTNMDDMFTTMKPVMHPSAALRNNPLCVTHVGYETC